MRRFGKDYLWVSSWLLCSHSFGFPDLVIPKFVYRDTITILGWQLTKSRGAYNYENVSKLRELQRKHFLFDESCTLSSCSTFLFPKQTDRNPASSAPPSKRVPTVQVPIASFSLILISRSPLISWASPSLSRSVMGPGVGVMYRSWSASRWVSKQNISISNDFFFLKKSRYPPTVGSFWLIFKKQCT